jgi:segregation and condensation protein B
VTSKKGSGVPAGAVAKTLRPPRNTANAIAPPPPDPPSAAEEALTETPDGAFAGDRDTLASAGASSHGLAPAPLASEPSETSTTDNDPIEQARDLSHDHLRGLLEALVFASDKPMTSGELARMASAPLKHVKALLTELKESYAHGGVVLDELAGGWLFRTNVQFAPFVRELTSERPVKLTRAQVETLAITAYRQPITRPEIDEIRGVDSGATLKLLLERDLVRILGKKDEPGRPLLYGTTTHFLEFFGLKSLKDLPTLREFTELSDESRAVAEATLGDVLPQGAAAGRPSPVPSTAAPATDAEPHRPGGRAIEAADEDRFAERVGPQQEAAPDHDTLIPSAPPTGDIDNPNDASDEPAEEGVDVKSSEAIQSGKSPENSAPGRRN